MDIVFPSPVIVYEPEVAGWVTFADQAGYDIHKVREMSRYYLTFIKRVPPPRDPDWWETLTPPYDLVIPNAIVQFYDEAGTPLLSKKVTWVMKVSERKGVLLKVWDQPDPARPDWWVRATDVLPEQEAP